MKRAKFNALQRGDLIRHFNGNSYVVVDSNGRGRVTVARTINATNPEEWERVEDDDDPRFRNRPAEPQVEPEAGFGMGEPESTPPTWVRPSTPFAAVASVGEVPADCASWENWNNARAVRTPSGPVPRQLFGDEHKVVGRFEHGRFVATADSTPVEPGDLDLERELTGNTTTTTSTTSTTRPTNVAALSPQPAVRLGRRAFDALRGPFDVSARPDEPVDFWIWSPVLETWVVGAGFVILVGGEQ